jgi:hypothetical protein
MQMLLQRMHTTVGQEASQMQRSAAPDQRGHGFDNHSVRRQLATPRSLADAEDVLIDDPPRADIEVSNL